MHLRSVSGGVAKSYRPSSPGRSLKAYAKPQSKAQCLQILKSLLPNAKEQEHASEVRLELAELASFTRSLSLSLQLELVRETIAYISHLESILSPSQQPAAAAAEQQVRARPAGSVLATCSPRSIPSSESS